jgi:hypothetical protein
VALAEKNPTVHKKTGLRHFATFKKSGVKKAVKKRRQKKAVKNMLFDATFFKSGKLISYWIYKKWSYPRPCIASLRGLYLKIKV